MPIPHSNLVGSLRELTSDGRPLLNIREYGCVPSPTASPVDVSAGLANAMAAARPDRRRLYAPGHPATHAYHFTSEMVLENGIEGDHMDITMFRAVDPGGGFVGSELLALTGPAFPSVNYKNFTLSAGGLALPCMGNQGTTANQAGTAGGPGVLESVRMQSCVGDVYTLNIAPIMGGGAFGLTGATLINCYIRQNGNAKLMLLDTGADDIQFYGCRFNMALSSGNTGPQGIPIRWGGINILMDGCFYVISPFESSYSGTKSVFTPSSTGSRHPFVIRNSFFEHAQTGTPDLDYLFSNAGAMHLDVDGLHLSITDGANTFEALARCQGSASSIRLARVRTSGTDVRFKKIVELENIAGDAPQANDPAKIELLHNSLRDENGDVLGLEDIIGIPAGAGAQTYGRPRASLTGEHDGLVLNHDVTTLDGSTPHYTHRNPTIVALPRVDLSGTDVEQGVSPIKGKIQAIKSVVDTVLATGDATLTPAQQGVGNLSGTAITVTQSGSAVGDVDEFAPTETDNDNDIEAGESFSVTVGGSATAGRGNVYAEIAPRGLVRPRNFPAARFDGSTHLARGTDLTGASNNAHFMIAVAFAVLGGNGTERTLYDTDNGALRFGLNTSNVFFFSSDSDAVGTIALDMTGTTAILADDGWHTAVIRTDTDGTPQLYIDRVDETTIGTNNGTAIDITQPNHYIGARNGGTNRWNGEIGSLFISHAGGDADLSADLSDFVNSSNVIPDYGANGDDPLGSTALLYTRDIDWRQFGLLNEGGGGNFAVAAGAILKPKTLPTW